LAYLDLLPEVVGRGVIWRTTEKLHSISSRRTLVKCGKEAQLSLRTRAMLMQVSHGFVWIAQFNRGYNMTIFNSPRVVST